MMPTKEQWADIEKQLAFGYGRVELECDGYKVVAVIEYIAPLKQGIVVFVNGEYKGEWMKGHCDEARKFHREVKRFLYSTKQRDTAKASLKKRWIKSDAMLRETYERMSTASSAIWYPWWTTPKAFCRHIRKTCTDIEVIKIGFGE